jgi:DnaJ-class molecular chaperone
VLERFNACEECGGSGTYISTLACDPNCETFTCETCGGDGLNLDGDEMLEAYKDFVHDTGVEWLESE